MFALLPQDITFTVLKEWLNKSLSVLSKLDVAVCNHSMRREWLQLLRRGKVDEFAITRRIVCCLAWLGDRNIQVNSLIAHMSLIDELNNTTVGAFQLANTTTLGLNRSQTVVESAGFKQLLSFFPNVTCLDFQNCPVLTDRILYEVLHLMNCPLQKLYLGSGGINERITSFAVVLVVEKFCSTLTVLDCDVLDDWALDRLSECCSKLTYLSMGCNSIRDGDSLVTFCGHNPDLNIIDIQGRRDCVVGNSAVIKIAADVCLKVRRFILDLNAAITIDLLPILLTRCKDISAISICGMEVVVGQDRAVGRVCNVGTTIPVKGLLTTTTQQQVCAFLDSVPLPICKFGHTVQASPRFVIVNKGAVQLLAEKFGSQLVGLWIKLDSTVFREDFQLLLANCPHLLYLSLMSADLARRKMVEDGDLLRLHSHCPELKTLKIYRLAPNITDEGLQAAIKSWSKLTALGLVGCPLLTDAILPGIVEHIPNLQRLEIVESGITKEGLLTAAMEMIPKHLKTLVVTSAVDRVWMKEQRKQLKLALTIC